MSTPVLGAGAGIEAGAPVEGDVGQRWLLLVHQIPPKPDYLRVKIGRRLQRVGAVAVKNSVYVLPDTEHSLEDFQWIRTEIIDGGGDASTCRADFVDGLTSDQIRHLFRSARNADYAEIEAAARALCVAARRRDKDGTRPRGARPDDELMRLRKRVAAVAAIDFFGAPQRTLAEVAIEIANAKLRPDRLTPDGRSPVPADRAAYRGRTWVTRSGLFVDRIASAWLIRRFIDPDARFKFVRDDGYRPTRSELRFDMFEGEFTHEGDRCSFETLIVRFSLADAGLGSLAEVVHDIDLKDGKFGRDEAAGIECVLAGIVKANRDDTARLERGCQLFDDLYALFLSQGTEPSRSRSSGGE